MRRRESRPRPPAARFPGDPKLDAAFAEVFARLPKTIAPRVGVSGSFTDNDGNTVTVVDGIVTALK